MWAMIVKEFRQVRRDRRTLAMMIVMPVILLVVFGYAASFDVSSIRTVAAGPGAAKLASALGPQFDVVTAAPSGDRAWARTQLRDGRAAAAVVTTGGRAQVLIDGSQLFTARAALAALSADEARLAARGPAPQPAQAGALQAGALQAGAAQAGALQAGAAQAGALQAGAAQAGALQAGAAQAGAPQAQPGVTILYNPGLTTSAIMIPGLAGVILVFVGTMITSLGVVRERQSGTLEQLAVMPLRARDVFLGKIVPYFAVATLDLAIVLGVGVAVFGVPFHGSAAVFGLGALLFLFVTLGLGVLISSVSENQGQAIQLSFMVTLPQVLLSGLIFPLSSIVVGVRWISYILPLTYFNEIARGVMLRAEPIGPLWEPFVFLTLLGAVVVTLATLRFRSFLAPSAPRRGSGSSPAHVPAIAGDPVRSTGPGGSGGGASTGVAR